MNSAQKTMLHSLSVLTLAWLVLAAGCAGRKAQKPALDAAVFKDPPSQYRGTAMWGFDLSKVTEASAAAGVEELSKNLYGGFFITVSGANARNLDPAYVKQSRSFFQFSDHGIEYLSPEFFKVYRAAVEAGKKKGLSMIFYDDYFFPTGTVCGQLYMKHPEHMAKRLDMVEQDVTGPAKADLAVPKGTYMGAVLMNRKTFERIDISDRKNSGNHVVCDVPAGQWKAMAFYLNHDAVMKLRNPGLMDYLDSAAVDTFLAMSYDKFYAELKPYWGSVIRMAFYDEPSMHWLDGQMWTPAFNKNFETKYGYNPIRNYPALWYDIGPETSSARNALFGYRAELFQAFINKLEAWCRNHGIQLTGHLDQEEVPNPTPINGDLMKMFEHQDVPGADDIFIWGRSNRGYKVVTSAAFNYDKPVMMTETYAAYRKIDEKILFQVAMDQYAMGVNFQVPTAGIERRARNVPDLNRYVGRMSYLLQGGRHVADVAVLYPIASLQGCYQFQTRGRQGERHAGRKLDGVAVSENWHYAYTGGILPPEIDYMDVGEALYRGLRVDYTYLHPEVLESRCVIAGNQLVLNNKTNREEYGVLIVPGGDTLRVATANAVRDFYRQGGTVIATSRVAFRSAEPGRDPEVRQAMSDLFGLPADALVKNQIPTDSGRGYMMRRNPAGGRVLFVPKAEPALLETALKEVLPVRDVEFGEGMWPLKTGEAYDGALTYIHKVKHGRDVYFFANSSERPVATEVVLRGHKELGIWNPHTGERQPARYTHAESGGSPVTRVKLTLPAVSSLFYVQEP